MSPVILRMIRSYKISARAFPGLTGRPMSVASEIPRTSRTAIVINYCKAWVAHSAFSAASSFNRYPVA